MSFETKIFDNYSRVESTLQCTILESYLKGVSTRSIEDIAKQLGIDSLSASSVSRIAKNLDESVDKFLKRPIEHEIPYLFVDATYVKLREGGVCVNKAIFVVIGVRDDGYREILGAKLADSDSELYWESMFDGLKERGLSGVELVVSDGHRGIKKAVQRSFLGSSWQMCYVHYVRNILKYIPAKLRDNVAARLKEANGSELELQNLALELREDGRRNAADTIERFLSDVLSYKKFPPEYWKKIRTTNIVERLNREIKRRVRKVGSFPSGDSCMRLVGTILICINNEWLNGNRYLNIKK